MIKTYTPHIEREVDLREGTSDSQVWADTFTGLYHLPPKGTPKPKTVLDLGANIGLTAAHYRYLWPEAKIVAVEMDETNAELARKNAPDVIVRQEAVSTVSGLGVYDSEVEAFAYTFAPTRVESFYGVSVTCRTLAEIIKTEFGGPVDFVKMDIEGEEWKLLEHPEPWAPLVKRLVVEFHDPEESRARIIERGIGLLMGAGFFAHAHASHPLAVHAWR